MEIHVSNNKLRAGLEDEAARRRKYGADMAKKLSLRLDALRAAESLADFWPPNSGPERCHELKGDLAGVFSIDLKQPYRLLFKPVEAAPPADRSDEQARWKSITSIDIVAIEDTHG
ncbi:MAG TPA: type II toxin-antitoxin system RelE/ParE family toxin [Gemmatimonadaceae bacterium]|jgi:proteic killer suppression protein